MNTKTEASLVLSGPSGAGQSSLISKIIDDIGSTYFSISTTTRAMREGETNGVHYHFVSIEEFKKGLIILRQAQIYTQRNDWLVSGDDGEDSFHSRLKKELYG
jgi:guanylate kinase